VPTKEWFETQKKEAAEWAYNLMQRPFFILDTETASLNGEVIQLGLIDHRGDIVINQLVKPKGKIDPDSEAIHHISNKMVEDALTWDKIYPVLKYWIGGKLVIAYNAGYDKPVVKHTSALYDLPDIEATWDCAMLQYARFNGEWNEYHKSFKWCKLTKAIESFKLEVKSAHDATGDVLMTLEVIKEMSKYHKTEPKLILS
jgi:DNA polymerase-3 subunit epsilon